MHADRSQPIPATAQQKALWLLDQLDPAAGVAYNVWVAHRITGDLDHTALQKAAESLARRHESLRTRLVHGATGPLQVIDDVETVDIFQSEDWSGDSERPDVAAHVDQFCCQRIALDADAPVRINLITLDGNDHVLLIKGHHTVLDGASFSVLLEELTKLYSAYRIGSDPDLPPLPIQYADYAIWQSDRMSDDAFRNGLDYWRQTLAGAPPVTPLTTDRPRPVAMDYQSDTVALEVPPDQLSALKALARSRGATLFMVLEAALAALISRLSGVDDLVLGTAVSGRSRAEFEPQIGYFVNAIPLRHHIDPLEPFEAFLDVVKATVIDAFRHDDVPFASIVEAVSPARSPDHSPLFQVMLVLQAPYDAGERTGLRLPGTEAELLAENSGGYFDLSFDLIERPEGLVGRLSYASQLFDRDTAVRLASMYGRVLACVASSPETLVSALPLLDGAERRQVVEGFNDTAADYPRDRTVVELFAAQAATAPDSIAVVDGERELSYGDLDAASSRLGRHLIGLGVGPEVVVGVCLERSAELIVALLGIWKAGGAYLPLDPDYPEERVGFMLEDAGASVVLTTAGLAGRLPARPCGGAGGRVLELDDPATQAVLAGLPATPVTDIERRAPLSPSSLAYVIYTSGSTGTPKGVMVGHGNLCHLATYQARRVVETDGQRVGLFASIGFDASVWEVVMALCSSGCLAVIPASARSDGMRLADALRALQVEVVTVPPRLAADLGLLEDFPLRALISAGEAALPDAARHLAGQLDYYNAYGPTETTVCATAFPVSPDFAGDVSVPIGGPIWNTQVYVVDDRLQSQPVGVSGELLIGGVQVSRGYLGRAGLTAEKFIADPFSAEPGARLYRTGDLARWRPDGRLEFLGRIDDQVKIRGMRVELGEIEAALAACAGVAQAVVTAPEDRDGDRRLLAYLVPREVPDGLLAASLGIEAAALTDAQRSGVQVLALEGVVDLAAVRRALKRRLPAHMVPSGFVGLSCLPLTASGKVDRKALPAVEAALQRAVYEAPRGDAERSVAAAIGSVLGVADAGRHDSFFELGGHSLLAVRLVSLLEAETGKSVPVRAVFEAPTVAGLAAVLEVQEVASLEQIPILERRFSRRTV